MHPEFFPEFRDSLQLAVVLQGHRHVHLDGDTGITAGLDARDGTLPGTRHPPEPVVNSRIGRVETYRRFPDARPGEPHRGAAVDQGPVRPDDHPEPPVRPVSGDLKDIVPHQGFSAAEDHHRGAGLRNLVDEHLCFTGGEFRGPSTIPGIHIAVGAPQVAPVRDVP